MQYLGRNPQGNGDIYLVPSHTVQGQAYTVTVFYSGTALCECKGFSYRRKCSHSTEVLTALKANLPIADGVDASSPTSPPKECSRGCGTILDATHYMIGVCARCVAQDNYMRIHGGGRNYR